MRLNGIVVAFAIFGATQALCDPGPPAGGADIRAFRECQDSEIKKLDNGKRAEGAVAKDLAARCEKQYQAMAAAVLKMFGKPVWMSNYDSSLAAVKANRNPQSPLNRMKPGH